MILFKLSNIFLFLLFTYCFDAKTHGNSHAKMHKPAVIHHHAEHHGHKSHEKSHHHASHHGHKAHHAGHKAHHHKAHKTHHHNHHKSHKIHHKAHKAHHVHHVGLHHNKHHHKHHTPAVIQSTTPNPLYSAPFVGIETGQIPTDSQVSLIMDWLAKVGSTIDVFLRLQGTFPEQSTEQRQLIKNVYPPLRVLLEAQYTHEFKIDNKQ